MRYNPENLVIKKSNSSFGNYSIRISDTQVMFFMKYKAAIQYIETLKNVKDSK